MSPTQTLSLTEIHAEDEQPPLSTISNGSGTSEASSSSKNSFRSNLTNTTVSLASHKSIDQQRDFTEHDTSDRVSFVEKPEVITTLPLFTVTPGRGTPMTLPMLSVPSVTVPSAAVSPGSIDVSVQIPGSPTTDVVPTSLVTTLLPIESNVEAVAVSTSSQASTPSSTGTAPSNPSTLEPVKVRKITPSGGKDSPKREVYV